jgi:uncharacterized protein YkwD
MSAATCGSCKIVPDVASLIRATLAFLPYFRSRWVVRSDFRSPHGGPPSWTTMQNRRFDRAFLIWVWLPLAFGSSAAAQSSAPAELISNFRLQHGEGRVTIDSTLNRIASQQAAAMADKDVLDHGVLGPFGSRVASSGSGRAAENIAYGHDSFAKTLDQWIESSGHRRNLLMHGASRVGVASAKSSKTGRTYWAMVIAGGYEHPKRAGAKETTKETTVARAPSRSPQTCRVKILSLCLASR